MNKKNEFNNNYKDILYVISASLVEIRACDDIKFSQCLADIFHNAPTGISSGAPPEEIKKTIYVKAERLGYEDYIRSLFETARRKSTSE